MRLDALRLVRSLRCFLPRAGMIDGCLWAGLALSPLVAVMPLSEQVFPEPINYNILVSFCPLDGPLVEPPVDPLFTRELVARNAADDRAYWRKLTGGFAEPSILADPPPRPRPPTFAERRGLRSLALVK